MLQSIVITGSTGFVGKNLWDYLGNIYTVHPLKARFSQHQTFDIKGEAVIHLAGKAHDLKKVSEPKEYYESNYKLTKQLFDSFLNSDAEVFVFMSSVKACADKVEGILVESDSYDPKTHYGISKRQAEQYILSKQLPEDKRVYILRPCMIHGPGNKGNLNLLYSLVCKRIPWPLGAFSNQRSFLSIENLCFIIRELLENKEVTSGIYHLADDQAISTNELIEIIGVSLGKSSKIVKVPSWIISKTANLGDYLHLPLNSERLQKLTESYVVSNAKIKKALKKELPVSTKEGLIETIKSFSRTK